MSRRTNKWKKRLGRLKMIPFDTISVRNWMCLTSKCWKSLALSKNILWPFLSKMAFLLIFWTSSQIWKLKLWNKHNSTTKLNSQIIWRFTQTARTLRKTGCCTKTARRTTSTKLITQSQDTKHTIWPLRARLPQLLFRRLLLALSTT